MTGVPREPRELKLGLCLIVSVERQLSAPELSVDPCLPEGSFLVIITGAEIGGSRCAVARRWYGVHRVVDMRTSGTSTEVG